MYYVSFSRIAHNYTLFNFILIDSNHGDKMQFAKILLYFVTSMYIEISLKSESSRSENITWMNGFCFKMSRNTLSVKCRRVREAHDSTTIAPWNAAAKLASLHDVSRANRSDTVRSL